MQIHMPQAAAMSGETPCRVFVIQLERTMNTRDAGLLDKICAQKLDSRLAGTFFCQMNDEYVAAVRTEEDSEGSALFRDLEGILNYCHVQLETGVVAGMSRLFMERRVFMMHIKSVCTP